jgi:hypothetical protein
MDRCRELLKENWKGFMSDTWTDWSMLRGAAEGLVVRDCQKGPRREMPMVRRKARPKELLMGLVLGLLEQKIPSTGRRRRRRCDGRDAVGGPKEIPSAEGETPLCDGRRDTIGPAEETRRCDGRYRPGRRRQRQRDGRPDCYCRSSSCPTPP